MRSNPAISPSKSSPPQQERGEPLLFMILAGVFFFIAVLKFSDPVILDKYVFPVHGLDEIIDDAWRVEWGYVLALPVFLCGLFFLRLRPFPKKWPLLLPLLWLGWQFVSATRSIAPDLTRLTLEHFTASVAFFYLGLFALRGVKNPWPIWVGLALALCWTMHSALVQHFGGLEATRKLVLEGKGIDLPPGLLSNPDYLKRLNSDRVSGTFMYPNSFAGAVLLFLPLTLVFLWYVSPKLRPAFRWLFVIILGALGLACMYWSGSKAAWVIMVGMGVIAVVYFPLKMGWKAGLILVLLGVGLAGYHQMYEDSIKRGKTSMVARLAYWKAASRIFREHPVLGSGPGTFGVAFERIKGKDEESARLTHNDYIEQASDSGLFGFLTYTGLIVTSFFELYRYRFFKNEAFQMTRFAVALGVLSFFAHCMMEFHLYYPALAWPAFLLLGWLWSLGDDLAQYR